MNPTNRILQSLFTLGFLGCLAAVPLRAAKPADGQGNWESLKQLAPGDQIRVVLNDAKSYRGQFQNVSDEAVVVRLATGEQAFQRETVLRVSAKSESHRGRNALIGAVVGGAAGAGLGAYGGANTEAGAGLTALAGSLLFAPIGGGIGALVPTGGWHDVYRAR